MTAYHYPRNADLPPSHIQKLINTFETMVLEKQTWLDKCLLHSDDSEIKRMLAGIEYSQEKAIQLKKEWNEMIYGHLQGPELVEKRNAVKEQLFARQKLAQVYRDELTVYIRSCDNEVLKTTQTEIDEYKTWIAQYEADKLKREDVLREMAEQDSLHHQAPGKFIHPGETTTLHNQHKSAGISHYRRP
jgi:hypothetical protein